MFELNRRVRGSSLVALAVAAALYAQGSFAAPPETPDTDQSNLENVVVTGTRKVGMAVDDSPAPVQVVSAEVLQQSGSSDLMNALAFQVPSLNVSQQGTDLASATLVASMRALSPNHTLVLVNGKRRHFTSNVAVLGQYAGAASADLSFIPSSVIAKTEVLTDGAAALYGSDAIAGVVNLITKRDYTGGTARANVSGYDAGGGLAKNYQGDVGFGNSMAYFNLGLEFEHRDTVNRPGAPYGAAACVVARLTSGAAGCPTTNSGLTASGYPTSTGNAALARENEYNMQYYPYYPFNSHQGDPPEIERKIGFFSTGVFLNDDTEVYATGSFGLKNTLSLEGYRRPSQDGGFDRNGNGVRTDAIGGIGPRSGVALTEADLNMYPFGFTPKLATGEKDWELGVGVSGSLAGWRYDLSGNYGTNTMDLSMSDSMNFTLWNKYGQSPSNFYLGKLKASQAVAALDLSHEFDVGIGMPLMFSGGLESRRDTYGIGAGEAASYVGAGASSFPGFSNLAASDHKRTNQSAFADVVFNPTSSWLVDIAGRYENYSDFGSKTVGKLTTRYDFSDKAALRGTISTGFRAPTMGENYYTAIQVAPTSATATLQAASVGSGLKPESSTNVSLGLVLRPLPDFTTTLDVYQIKIDNRTRIGNFAYSTPQGPTTRTGRSGGVPVATLADPADTDGNGVPDAEYNKLLGDALVAGGFIGVWNNPNAAGGSFDSTARASISLGFFSNVLDTKTTGVDWVATYLSRFDWGRVNWLAAANYNKTEVTRAGRVTGFESIPLFGIADIWGIEKNSPDFRLNLGATVQIGSSLSVNVRENIYGPQSTIVSAAPYTAYSNIMSNLSIVDSAKINSIASKIGLPATTTPFYEQKIGVIATTNIEVTYKAVAGIDVSVGADNVFDKYPDKIPAAILKYNTERYAITGARDYLLGSPTGFFGRRLFAKVSYSW